jgi:hypothetical protein
MLPIAGGGILALLFWQFGGVLAIAVATLFPVLLVAGLRASIAVYPSRVEIVRKWFFVPYRRYTGRSIEDVSFGGDYGLDDGAIGVVVRLDGREVHLGTSKNMHYLHEALTRVAYERG